MGWTTWILAGSLLAQAAPNEPTLAPRYRQGAGAPPAAIQLPPPPATNAPTINITVPGEPPAAPPPAANPPVGTSTAAPPQTGPAEPAGLPSSTPPSSPSEPGLVTVNTRETKSSAAALLSSLLVLPDELKPSGRWVPLVEVLSTGFDRPRQIELTRAYWRLSVAVAQVRVAWDERRELSELQPLMAAKVQRGLLGEPLVDLESLLATSQARVQDASLKLLVAQQDLAEKMRLPLGSPLPLPADSLHLGTYTTRFEQIYSGQQAAAQARLIDRALPLRRELIEAHAAAAQAAHDAGDAAQDAWQNGAVPTSVLLETIEKGTRQRRSFLSAVRQYNDDIATYALSIPREPLSTAGLVGMLIKSDVPSTSAVVAQTAGEAELPGAVNPATFSAPVPLAETPRVARAQEPTLARPRTAAATLPPDGPRATIAIPTEISGSPTSLPATEPRAAGASEFGPYEARKEPSAAESVGLYSALAELTPAKRAQELANLLHWDRQLPEDIGTPINLEECLSAVSESERRGVIAAFWRTRETAAGYQLTAQELEQLDAVAPVVLRLRQQPTGPAAMLLLRHARLALKAELIEARLTLLVDQFALTQAVRRPLDGKWLLPTTAPHGGGYRMKPDAQPVAVVDAPTFRRAVTMIPAMHQTLEQRSTAVVAADAVRTVATAKFEAGQESMDKLLVAVGRQADETREFLATLTQYNLEIADYALAVLPAQTPAAAIVGTMVLRPAERQL